MCDRYIGINFSKFLDSVDKEGGNSEELQKEIFSKVSNLILDNNVSEETYNKYMGIFVIEEDIKINYQDKEDKYIYDFSLTKQGEDKLILLYKILFLKDKLNKIKNKNIDNDLLLLELDFSTFDSKYLERIFNRYNFKSTIKTQIEELINIYDLENDFKNFLNNRKKNFNYQYVINKPKELKEYKTGKLDKKIEGVIKKHWKKTLLVLGGIGLLGYISFSNKNNDIIIGKKLDILSEHKSYNNINNK